MNTCETCGELFERAPRRVRFCSAKCRPISAEGLERLRASKRGDNSPMRRAEVRAKRSATMRERGSVRGEKHPNWKGGITQRSDGRYMVRIGPGKMRLRYHVVWDETHPDDPIRPGDIIHHINHDPTDDRPENLMKISQSQHAREHDFGHHPGARRGF